MTPLFSMAGFVALLVAGVVLTLSPEYRIFVGMLVLLFAASRNP
jgi:hypothetical protein